MTVDPILDSWHPETLEWAVSPIEIPDIMLVAQSLVFSRQARDRVGSALGNCGEWLGVSLPDGRPGWLFHPIGNWDGLDWAKSIPDSESNSDIPELLEYAFDADKLQEAPLVFRSSAVLRNRTILVSGEFKRLVENACLKGIEFEPIWIESWDRSPIRTTQLSAAWTDATWTHERAANALSEILAELSSISTDLSGWACNCYSSADQTQLTSKESVSRCIQLDDESLTFDADLNHRSGVNGHIRSVLRTWGVTGPGMSMNVITITLHDLVGESANLLSDNNIVGLLESIAGQFAPTSVHLWTNRPSREVSRLMRQKPQIGWHGWVRASSDEGKNLAGKLAMIRILATNEHGFFFRFIEEEKALSVVEVRSAKEALADLLCR